MKPAAATRVVHCTEEPYDIYIGRPHPLISPDKWGLLGNPYKPGAADGTRAEVLEKYRRYAVQRMRIDPAFRAAIKACRGKVLGCWCKRRGRPQLCHGDVIKELAEND